MDLKSTIAIILKDLEDARNILDDIKKYPDVPAIQVELAKAKCRSAGEVIKVLAEEDEGEKMRGGEEEKRRKSEEEKRREEEASQVEPRLEELEKSLEETQGFASLSRKTNEH